MIQSDCEYMQIKDELEIQLKAIDAQKNKMHANGLSTEQIKLATDPLISFSLKLKEELEEYEKSKQS